MKNNLIGYIRKSNNGGALRINLDYEALEHAEKYETKDGRQYVGLVANLAKIGEIMDGTREVTSVCQLIGDHE
jgi:hypothetical protein